jgi:DNA-binding CsgD family transcriptional regulator
MTWKQYYVDFAVLFLREKGRSRDVAAIFSASSAMVYALLKSRGYSLKELKTLPPLPQKDRSKIIREFCKDKSNAEALRSTLQSYNVSFEDFLAKPLSSFAANIEKTTKKGTRVMSDRDKEIAELRRKGTTLRTIGSQYGITRERVRQVVLLFNKYSDDPVDIVKARRLGYQPSPEKLARQNGVVELCRTGLTYQQIANTLGIEKKYVFQDIARYNQKTGQHLRARKEDNRKITDEVRATIIQERKKGTTNFALAKRFNVSYGTICRVIKEAGLTRPRKTPKRVKRVIKAPVKKGKVPVAKRGATKGTKRVR